MHAWSTRCRRVSAESGGPGSAVGGVQSHRHPKGKQLVSLLRRTTAAGALVELAAEVVAPSEAVAIATHESKDNCERMRPDTAHQFRSLLSSVVDALAGLGTADLSLLQNLTLDQQVCIDNPQLPRVLFCHCAALKILALYCIIYFSALLLCASFLCSLYPPTHCIPHMPLLSLLSLLHPLLFLLSHLSLLHPLLQVMWARAATVLAGWARPSTPPQLRLGAQPLRALFFTTGCISQRCAVAQKAFGTNNAVRNNLGGSAQAHGSLLSALATACCSEACHDSNQDDNDER